MNAVVLGGTGGIGLAITTALQARGYAVTVGSRRDPGPVLTFTWRKCDIRSFASVAALFRALPEPPVLVVNAAGAGHYAPLDQDHEHEWRQMLETNVLGLANLFANVEQAAPACRDVVVVGSLAGHRPSRTVGADFYSVAKVAAVSLVEQYRRLVRARGGRTRVTLLSPGLVDHTGFEQAYFEGSPEAAQPLYGKYHGHRRHPARDC